MNKQKLKEKYEKACNEYVKLFCEKHDIEFDFWISNEVGGMASFGEFYAFDMETIRQDIDNDFPPQLILQWVNDNVDNVFDGSDFDYSINYPSYARGLRYDELRRKRDRQKDEMTIDFKEKFKDFLKEYDIDLDKFINDSEKLKDVEYSITFNGVSDLDEKVAEWKELNNQWFSGLIELLEKQHIRFHVSDNIPKTISFEWSSATSKIKEYILNGFYGFISDKPYFKIKKTSKKLDINAIL